MKQNQLLNYRHIQAKIELDEQEDVLILTQNGEAKVYFSSHGASLETVLLEADKLLMEG
jgi:hypothetical protein